MGLLLVRMRSHNGMGTPPTIVADRICTGGDQRHETPPVAPASRFRGAVCPIRQAESKVVLIMSNILDSFRLDNKVALVTGSAGGMGAAIAIALAQAGAAIATHDIRPPADTVSTIEAAGGKAAAFAADLRSEEHTSELQ